jgi:beta-phosphoglucomutase-like phosphatase (HAD superfamily)
MMMNIGISIASQKHVEQQRVERREHADHQAFEDQERREVLRRALLDHRPARDHDQRRDEGRQHDQRHRDAVDAEVVPGVEAPIHGSRSTNCIAAVVASKPRHSGTLTARTSRPTRPAPASGRAAWRARSPSSKHSTRRPRSAARRARSGWASRVA